MKTFKDYICKEVLANDIVVSSELNNAEEVDINGNLFGVSLERI